MTQKIRKQYLLLTVGIIALLAVTILAGCAPDTIQKTYFRRNDTYTTAAEVPGLWDDLDPTDLTSDEVVRIVDRWAGAKYHTSTTAEAGYEQKNRLNIPYRYVGVLQVGPYQLVLPPRTYTNLPEGDDEVVVQEALCVDPGMIAWRFDYSSKVEKKVARAECYVLPKAGWVIEPSLKVSAGQVAHRMMQDGKFEFRQPIEGAYPDEIGSLWTVEAAVNIMQNEFGIYFDPNTGGLRALGTGVHYDVVPRFVNVYKTDEMRYRTLDVHVYENNKNPGDPACASELCATVITRIEISGTDRLAAFNMDVYFKMRNPLEEPSVLPMYADLGSMDSAIVDNVEGPTRNNARNVGTDMTQKELESIPGTTEYEERVRAANQADIDEKGAPFVINKVNVRGKDFDDAELRAAAEEAEVAIQKERDRIAAAEARERAIEAETSALEALREQVRLKMEVIQEVINTADGISCTELVYLEGLDLIEIDWDSLPPDICSSGNTTITVTAGGTE